MRQDPPTLKRLLLAEGSDDVKHLDVFLKLCSMFFKMYYYCTLNGLLYSVNITFICTEKATNLLQYHFIAIFALLYWSGTELAISPRYAYIRKV